MEVTLLYFADCPNWRETDVRLRAALSLGGTTDVSVTRQEVVTAADADRLGLRGSPTILVDGADPFADEGAPVALSCRIFMTPEGPAGAPTVEQLAAALRR